MPSFVPMPCRFMSLIVQGHLRCELSGVFRIETWQNL